MNYYSDNKTFHLRYKNIENYLTYCKLFNKFSIKYIKNKYKKSIDLYLEDFDIIQRVDNKLKLYQILYDFFNKLSKIEINESNLDLENLIIVKHKVHKYFILGMTFNNVQNRLNYFDYEIEKPISKQLKYLIFIPICNENVIKNIELFFYNYEITVFTSSKVKLFNLPIITISEITNLKSILYFFTVWSTLSGLRISMLMQRAISAIPAFPGATYMLLHSGFCLIAQARECSRPPLPNINIFILESP